MTDYTIIYQRFLSEFRNGTTFATNPTTDYYTFLKGNVGERCKLIQSIEINVTINPLETQTIQFNTTSDATYGEFVGTGINFLNEGLYLGAGIDVTWSSSGGAVSTTCELISGVGFNKVRIVKAPLLSAGLVDGDIKTDIKIRLTSVPTSLVYKYGLNEIGTPPLYISNFDTSQQAYYLNGITTSFASMSPIGLGNISWNISTIQVKFIATVGTYFHQYQIEHIFKIPHYIEGEYSNLTTPSLPNRFLGTSTLKYDNAWYFGGTASAQNIKVDIDGGIGEVGYFNESYNGFPNNYLIQHLNIANADNSGVLEGTVANTVTFQIKKTDGDFTATESKVIFNHSKLPTSTEYQASPTPFNTIWIMDNVVQVEGDAPIGGTAVFTNVTVTINADPTILDCSCVITYDSAEQALILNTSNYLIWVTCGNIIADPDDRVNLIVDVNQFSKNLDVTGLITLVDVEFYEPFEAFTGSRRLSSWTGWDGDLGGVRAIVTRDSTEITAISKAEFKIIASNGVDEFVLLKKQVPIGKPVLTTVGGEYYQLINVDVQNDLTIPSTQALNRVTGTANVPVSQTGVQLLTFKMGFQTPWREWVENLNVDLAFYDSGEQNNNLNYKTSNYSGALSYDIYPIWEFTVLSHLTPPSPSAKLSVGNVETIYRKLTTKSNIYDFDSNDGTFTGSSVYYAENGDVTDNIFVDQKVRVEIELSHSLGVITLADIEGYIWIEQNGSNIPPWFLHSSLDFTSPLNPLSPSDTSASGNVQFVEVYSVNNLVTLICYTNKSNLQDGVNYNIYGRIKNKKTA